jgi:acyl transferase domain-containing protein/NAD(P)H-dependent flavin oxidoreductase YrpB (nitropropane dioxygenase family)/NAD(P)-dependent dehydrogenase (short-subunit alcohol dehydrogenase family)
MTGFIKFICTPAGRVDPALAIAGSRAGGVGVLNAELTNEVAQVVQALDRLAEHACGPYGLKIHGAGDGLAAAIRRHATRGLSWLIVDAERLHAGTELFAEIRGAGVRILAEVRSADWAEPASSSPLDGLVLKGNESGGFVGEDSSFILLQKWNRRTRLPLYVRGGVTPHVAAACAAVGVAGVVLDSQLLLMDEVRLSPAIRASLANLSGHETVAIGHGEGGEYFRLLVRPGLSAARELAADAEGAPIQELRDRAAPLAMWCDPAAAILPVGQDVGFAAAWRARYGSVAAVVRAIDSAIDDHVRIAGRSPAISADAPLARAMGVRFPIIQGPMTRVSDTAEFALAVAQAGALPMLALAVLRGEQLENLLRRTAELLRGQRWGIGLLGFAPQDLLDEQLTIAGRFAPDYAIIAGGRPDQAVQLEKAGVPSFLHVPSANLIATFLQEGARRFILEGRECGGHIGPLSSFVLWSSIVDRLLVELKQQNDVRPDELELIFAGGIHDDVSSAMLQVLVAPLSALGVKVGILMGSAYLFTKEIVSSGAIVEQFQRTVLHCERTVNLESGIGHASRCAYTPFAREFFRQRHELTRTGMPADERRHVLDDLILGRLRIASKGLKRTGLNGALQTLPAEQQLEEGMYMLGQVATLRDRLTDLEALHREVTVGAEELMRTAIDGTRATREAQPDSADIAVIGMACVLPKANSPDEFWQSILEKQDAITEIPRHRWDWRLYYDEDRTAKDKVYSKWGGFLDDIPFDPTLYGMPPKSIESVDPMQLMGLEVARRTLADSGYLERPFDRDRASVILGASGGIGDFGMQYGLRSELPRFSGNLPAELAARLPEWTEDSFAGILPNVVAGRIANRLNFGGMNVTADAACASSLAAIYHGVSELTAGRTDFVIAGGIDTVQGPFGYLCFSKTHALSPRGRCSTFDSGADGIVISEGIAMVALKRLADAKRDGDRVYAVIKGIGASSDGNAKGLTAPLPAGQLRAMRRAYEMAGFGPASVGLFEAHGTGTVAGDTAELESTTRLLQADGANPRHAAIGSVKTIVGHTKATAGAAGLAKTVLALHHRVLPPHSNVSNPNGVLLDQMAPLYLVNEPTAWIAPKAQPRRAACSAFGFGGTNFHIVLEEFAGEYRDWLHAPSANAWSVELFVWRQKDRAALTSQVEAFERASANLDGVLLRDLAASLATTIASPSDYTLAIVAGSVAELRTKVQSALSVLRGSSNVLPPGAFCGSLARPLGKVAFLFPGQGSQYPGMMREVALHFGCVADALGEADKVLGADFEQRYGSGSTLSRFIVPRGAYDEAAQSAARQALASTDVAQPALGAVEVGLLRLILSLGVHADMCGGHSYGEFVALHAAGAIDMDALMRLSAARGRFIVDAARTGGTELGTMAAVNATRQVVESAIEGIDGVVIANHNAPLQTVVSGPRAGVAAAAAILRKNDVEVTDLPVAAAFHSRLVQPARKQLSELIATLPWSPVVCPTYSNTTARPHAHEVEAVKQQMAEHLVRPVEFVAEIERMYEDGARLFIEVGPKAVLSRLTSRILDGRPHVAISLDDGSGLRGLLCAIGQMLCAGIPLRVNALFDRRDCRVGDPARPATLLRQQPLSKHAWMLNGSRARRASEPVHNVGVTLEDVQARRPVNTPPAELLAESDERSSPRVPAAPPALLTRTLPRNPQPVAALREDRTMDDDRRAPHRMANSDVMSEYFETMRQFLETQERVMASYLGHGGVTRLGSRPPPLALNVPRMAALAAAPAVVPAAKPHVPVAAPTPKTAEPTPAVTAAEVPPPSSVSAEPAPAQTASTQAGGALGRDKVQDMLLGIVEQKTGYPRDMLGLDQNLEADLGIDSIKRVEIVGALMKMLPDAHREALRESRSKINTQSKLSGMLDLIMQAKLAGAVTVPFDLAGAGSNADVAVSRPSRLVMCPRPEPLDATAGRRLTPGRFVLTCDRLGVASALAQMLRARGADVVLVDQESLRDEAALLVLASRLRSEAEIAGIVHLAALGGPAVSDDDGPAQWRSTIQINEKSFYILLREFSSCLASGAHVVAASGLGGLFGRAGTARTTLRVEGGSVGAIKSLLEERPELRVKAVDLDTTRGTVDLASVILAEIELDGGRQEVGYPNGQRTVFSTEGEQVRLDSTRAAALSNLVVLATAGARGITAEVLRELARPGNTLVLTGRSQIPDREPPEIQKLLDARALRSHFVDQGRAAIVRQTPREIEKQVQSILGLREMRANIDDFRACGCVVEYHSVDVTDESAMRELVDCVKSKHGRIDGVVHGAGLIEDKRLADKDSASWSRVVETKVIGLMLLQKLIDPVSLKFFTVFSSVAGRYGNSGQSDYATANELMNRICVTLQARWGERVRVNALCWGPWGATKFGAGMVTPETEAKFEAKKVSLVSATLGRRLFRDEIAATACAPVEIICGQGPWEEREAELGVIHPAPQSGNGQGKSIAGPLLVDANLQTARTGERVYLVRLDPAQHLYLSDSVEGDGSVLPASIALEMMAEAARSSWPGWCVTEIHEFRVLNSLKVGNSARDLQVHLSPPPYGSSEGFDVSITLKTDPGTQKLQTHYQCVARVERHFPVAPTSTKAAHNDGTVPSVYGDWLPPGPRLRFIDNVDGLSPAGSAAQVRGTSPSDWLPPASVDGSRWLFDPALLEAAAQMLAIWMREYRSGTASVVRFGRVIRYRDSLPSRMHMEFVRIESSDASTIRADVVFFSDLGEAVFAIEELDGLLGTPVTGLHGEAWTAESTLQ